MGYFESEQIAANDMIADLQHPDHGPSQAHAQGCQLSPLRRCFISCLPTPLLGEHGEQVLLEAGLSLEEIADLRASEVLRVDTPPTRRDTP